MSAAFRSQRQMLDRLVQTVTALALPLVIVFLVAAFGALEQRTALFADTGHGIEAQMEAPTGGNANCPGCPDDNEQSRSTCSGGACPSALLSGGPAAAPAPRPLTYEVLQERHKTSALKPELGPPRLSL